MAEFLTPFRQRYERSRGLALDAQIEECADYLQHPDILITEFLEAYYLVERQLDPEREDEKLDANLQELVLEPFAQAREFRIRRGERVAETVCCVGGAFDPLTGVAHPAIARRGLDYVGSRSGETQRIVLGVTETDEERTAYLLLLRGLNCLAELSPPFQVARLQRHVIRGPIDSDARFDLQIGISKRARSEREVSLLVLARDLAEVFKARIGEREQFGGSVGVLECLEFEGETPDPEGIVKARWRT